MKRIAFILAFCILCSLCSLTALAKEPEVVIAKRQIALTASQTTFETVIEITPESAAYAGVEIGVACPESITVTASSGSSGSMSAGPVLANGLYWTSFFEADNTLSGTMKISLRFSCPESFEGGNIVIEKAKIFTKTGASVKTEEFSTASELNIVRDGTQQGTVTQPGNEQSIDIGTEHGNSGNSNTAEPDKTGKNPETDIYTGTANSSAAEKNNADSPQTGDAAVGYTIIYALLFLASGGVLLFLWQKRKTKAKKI